MCTWALTMRWTSLATITLFSIDTRKRRKRRRESHRRDLYTSFESKSWYKDILSSSYIGIACDCKRGFVNKVNYDGKIALHVLIWHLINNGRKKSYETFRRRYIKKHNEILTICLHVAITNKMWRASPYQITIFQYFLPFFFIVASLCFCISRDNLLMFFFSSKFISESYTCLSLSFGCIKISFPECRMKIGNIYSSSKKNHS